MFRFLLAALSAASLWAQSPAPLDPAFASFFEGKWSCSGEFANGKKIEADMEFDRKLSDKWLSFKHTDRPPNKYKAIGAWGMDLESGQLVALQEDNGGGARLFVSKGWNNNSVVFELTPILSHAPRQERFTYTKESADTFRMKYERGLPDGSWKLGDSLLCKRAKKS